MRKYVHHVRGERKKKNIKFIKIKKFYFKDLKKNHGHRV